MKRSIIASSDDKDLVRSAGGKGEKGGKAGGKGGGSRKGGSMKLSIISGSDDNDLDRSAGGKGEKGGKGVGLTHHAKVPATKKGIADAETLTHGKYSGD